MCNVVKAKKLLKKVKDRTERDLYYLRNASLESVKVDSDMLPTIEIMCNGGGYNSPLYEVDGNIKLKYLSDENSKTLAYLASEYSIVFDLSKL
jgi:hypothetical protein